MTDGRTDGQTDGWTDGRTDGQTDGGDCNIPNAFLKKRGDNNDITNMILALQYSTQGVKMIMCNVQAMIYHCILPTVTYQNYYLKLHMYRYTTQSGSTIYI